MDEENLQLPIRNGYCQVFPPAGIALMTFFSIHCYKMRFFRLASTFKVYQRQSNTFNRSIPVEALEAHSEVLFSGVKYESSDPAILNRT